MRVERYQSRSIEPSVKYTDADSDTWCHDL